MKINYLLIILFLNITLYAQNTVGVLSNSENSFNGFTLFTAQTETYLINNCGEIINQWSSNYQSGVSVYLLENGNLLRPAKINNTNIAIPGIGGRIELFDWDGNIIWEYNYSTNLVSQHHDIFPMPNGNILMLAATTLNKDDAIQMGRDPANLNDEKLFNEQILELEPVGTDAANIVWEWNIKNHVIQDFDNTKDNFGIISENPQLLDINYLGISNGEANWLHINSIQYNAQLDQIILSTRRLNEIYIIDHSTTTAEAATSTGGTYQKGGDILYRWGNPLAYSQGTSADQKLFGQHYPHWIPDGYTDAGKIILFNNGFGRSPGFSEVNILNPPTNSVGFYAYITNTAYGPLNPDYVYTSSIATDFYSPILSSAQRLPNGNTLICEGTSGHFFEINLDNDIVWEYINPVGESGILSQGDNPQFSANSMFRVKRYAPDYAAFNGRDLTPGSPIELNPDLSNCSILGIADISLKALSLYPNPVVNSLNIIYDDKVDKVEIYDVQGRKIKIEKLKKDINFTTYSSGIYFLKIFTHKGISTKKVIKI